VHSFKEKKNGEMEAKSRRRKEGYEVTATGIIRGDRRGRGGGGGREVCGGELKNFLTKSGKNRKIRGKGLGETPELKSDVAKGRKFAGGSWPTPRERGEGSKKSRAEGKGPGDRN